MQLGDRFRQHASEEGQRNERLRRQSSAVIDFEAMLPTGAAGASDRA
jgi:hypothetical protein